MKGESLLKRLGQPEVDLTNKVRLSMCVSREALEKMLAESNDRGFFIEGDLHDLSNFHNEITLRCLMVEERDLL